VSWKKALSLVFSDKATIVETHDFDFHSVSMTIKAPAVVRLVSRASLGHVKVRFSRQNILIRDGFACQYCHDSPGPRGLNIDHVVPRARGGKTTWENVVAACIPCNSKKSSRTPREAGMTLRKTPRKPDFLPLTLLRIRSGAVSAKWQPYLYWTGKLDEDRT